jgi:quinol monooxygenase YgiN
MGDTYFRTTHYHFTDLDLQAQDTYTGSLAEQARANTACLRFDVWRKDQPPGHWVLHESWQDAQSCKDFHASAPAQTLQQARVEHHLNHPSQAADADKPATPTAPLQKKTSGTLTCGSVSPCVSG